MSEKTFCDGCDCILIKKESFELNVRLTANEDREISFLINKTLCRNCCDEFKQQIQAFFKWQSNKQEGM